LCFSVGTGLGQNTGSTTRRPPDQGGAAHRSDSKPHEHGGGLIVVPLTPDVSDVPDGGVERGNFSLDPTRLRQRMMERFKEGLEIDNDDEWNLLRPRIEKVIDARREALGGAGTGRGRATFRPQPGGPGGANAAGRARLGEPSPEAVALQKAIDGKATPGEIKAALAKYDEVRKAKEEQLKAARENLRKALTARQEAIASLLGLL
jgi:hypothetical protein